MSLFEYVLLSINAGALITLIVTQGKIISNYKTVFDSTDIKRLAEFYKKIDELNIKHTMATSREVMSEVLKDFSSRIGTQFDEMATFINSLYLSLPEKDAEEFIRNHMPHCKQMFPYKGLSFEDLMRNAEV